MLAHMLAHLQHAVTGVELELLLLARMLPTGRQHPGMRTAARSPSRCWAFPSPATHHAGRATGASYRG
ncbi:hypothetical protein EYF80_012115 [Liparis tanakae]|uniref:Uncharacterized protein n=1 Tax=Liparis tanakae TaxID=230148 RepID=A0A4Z2III5_9TELE|nr:hypothetical protein EYF80_012115 [Liparis tanakae]